jgi:hypothetical protein
MPLFQSRPGDAIICFVLVAGTACGGSCAALIVSACHSRFRAHEDAERARPAQAKKGRSTTLAPVCQSPWAQSLIDGHEAISCRRSHSDDKERL